MPTDVAIPEMGESVSEVVLLEWLKSEGDYVGRDDPICVLETDKANVELPSPAAGVLHPAQEVDAKLAVGDVVATIDEGSAPVQEGTPAEVARPGPGPEAPAPEVAPDMLESLSPAVRGLVQEHGIDPRDIVGTGRGGRGPPHAVLHAIPAPIGPTEVARAAPVPGTRDLGPFFLVPFS